MSISSQLSQAPEVSWDPEAHSYIHYFRKSVERFPDKVAVRSLAGEITYRELDQLSDALAIQLIQSGITAEELVCVATRRDHEYFIGTLAVSKAGGCFVPLDLELPADRVEMIVEDAAVKRFIVAREGNTFPVPAGVSEFTAPVADEYDAKLVEGWEWPEVKAEQLIYSMFTSGSTGRPKGVLIEHRAVVNFCFSIEQGLGVGSDDYWVGVTTVGFDISVYELFTSLFLGGSVYFATRDQAIDGQVLTELYNREHFTQMSSTTGTLRLLTEAGWQGDEGLTICFAGELMPRDLSETILNLPRTPRFANYFGPTEATIFATGHVTDDVERAHLIGWTMAGYQFMVVNEEGNEVEDGDTGELVIGGMSLARGYLGQPELTADKFRDFGEFGRGYLTGDLGRKSPDDGIFECLGRNDTQVKIRGYRIELGEIERVLAQHDLVQQVAVLKWEDEDTGIDFLAAYIVPSQDLPEGWEGTLKEDIGASLTHYMVPDTYVAMEEFEKNVNGKVDRKKFPRPTREFAEIEEESLAKNELEVLVAEAWCEVLKMPQVPRDTNFFDLGGKSVLVGRLFAKLKPLASADGFRVAQLFEASTVAAQAELLAGGGDVASTPEVRVSRNLDKSSMDEPIAIIGYSGRFPGADSVDDFWGMLCDGEEGIRDLSDDELREKGVPDWMISDPNYVKRGASILGADEFDAELFRISPSEAEMTDPQGRVFMESCHDALLHAGYPAESYLGRIGLFGGAGKGSYSWKKIWYGDMSADDLVEMVGNEKDYLTTRVSYRLGLRGASMPVQTACSSSLVAVHLARQSLLFGDSDIAMAGGVSLNFPHGVGYMAPEGTMFSPSGRCRVFSDDADGTMFSQACGVVVLKRLSDAQADGDTIHAVLMGSGVNNDGNRKVGFTAPSADGQAGALRDALGDLDTSRVRYIEAHGTATKLGDPIELEGLREVYDTVPGAPECVIGSAKANVGHTDSAAGIVGLIKGMMVAKNGMVPPAVNFEKPTDAFDFDASRFRVNTELEALSNGGDDDCLVAVSSFGLGGTNAHAILAPPPSVPAREKSEGDNSEEEEAVLIPVSASSKSSLKLGLGALTAFIEEEEHEDQDIAYSLRHGRPEMRWRTTARLIKEDGKRYLEHPEESEWKKAEEHFGNVYLFTGQGAQYPGMGRDLYRSESAFRDAFDEVSAIADPLLGCSLKEEVFGESSDAKRLAETWLTQPALFAVELANARLWMANGVGPDALIGHSIGEYAAAVVAGIFTVEQATRAVVERGRLMWELPRGSMAAVPLPSEEAMALISHEKDLDLASDNSPGLSVIAGPGGSVAAFIARQEDDGVSVRLLHTSHAFHSAMVEPVVEPFRKFLASLGDFGKPKVRVLSNVSGNWLTNDEATSPEYWAQHIRKPVLFSKGISTAIDNGYRHFIEMGPGRTLATFTQQSLPEGVTAVVQTSVRHPKEEADDHAIFLNAVGSFWSSGGALNWADVPGAEDGRRIPLPRYAYDRKRYWRDPEVGGGVSDARADIKNPELSQWFYLPTWSKVPMARLSDGIKGDTLVIVGKAGVSEVIAKELEASGSAVIEAVIGDESIGLKDGRAVLRPAFLEDFVGLCDALLDTGDIPGRVIFAPTLGEPDAIGAISSLHSARVESTESLLHFLRAAHEVWAASPFDLTVVSQLSCEVVGSELKRPEDALLRGMTRVVSQEFPGLKCRWVDLDTSDLGALPLEFPEGNGEYAVRSGKLWKAGWVSAPQPELPEAGDLLEGATLREGGAYLITGGLSGVGLELARYLAKNYKAKLVLASRSPLPPRKMWDREDSLTGKDRRSIAAVRDIEASGATVLTVSADVSNPHEIRLLRDQAEQSFGHVDGVFHAAGVLFDRPIVLKERVSFDRVLRPKVEGAYAMAEVFKESEFLFLFSSISSTIPPAGQVDYAAANCFQDALATYLSNTGDLKVYSANWAAWREVGMAARQIDVAGADFLAEEFEHGIDLVEGFESIRRILGQASPQVAVYPRDLLSAYDTHSSIQESVEGEELVEEGDFDRIVGEAPATTLETQLLSIFQGALRHREMGVLDDFFELGGDSLMAVGMLTRIRKETGIALPNSILYQAPDVRRLAAEVKGRQDEESEVDTTKLAVSSDNAGAESQGEQLANFVIPIETGGSDVPIFGIHGAGGSVLIYRQTAKAFAGIHPFYAIEDPLIKNEAESHRYSSVAAKARAYLNEILKVSAEGKIVLIGYSFGAVIATEIARIVQDEYPEREAVILNIDQAAANVKERLYSAAERLKMAWYRQPYASSSDRVKFVGRRFYDGLIGWRIYFSRMNSAYAEFQKTGKMSQDDTVRNRQIEKFNFLLEKDYEVSAVDVPMILLKGEDQGDRAETPADFGWSSLVSSLRIQMIPGSHMHVFDPENQQFIADQIARGVKVALQ